MSASSIQKPKEPERYLVAETDFDVIVHDIAVRDIGYLREPFALASDLERPFAVHKKVTTFRENGGMIFPDLAAKKRLAQRSKAGFHPIEMCPTRYLSASALLWVG